jgi:hypothetical protein
MDRKSAGGGTATRAGGRNMPPRGKGVNRDIRPAGPVLGGSTTDLLFSLYGQAVDRRSYHCVLFNQPGKRHNQRLF